jgi:hypothetical protein
MVGAPSKLSVIRKAAALARARPLNFIGHFAFNGSKCFFFLWSGGQTKGEVVKGML